MYEIFDGKYGRCDIASNRPRRLSNRRRGICLALLMLFCLAAPLMAQTASRPIVFWAPDSVEPSDIVLLYGGGLEKAQDVQVARLPDLNSAHPETGTKPAIPASGDTARALQPSEQSLKFQLPKSYPPGVYVARVRAAGQTSAPVVLNRPEIWFVQPTKLMPGLTQSQAPAGAKVQIVGKNLLLPGDKGAPKATLHASNGTWITLALSSAERFSVRADLPASLSEGRYELYLHNGFGGANGWSAPLNIEIRKPDAWPTTLYDVRKFGAKGDGLANDTAAVRAALAEAGKNGGGVVYFPWGTYRLTDYIFIPERTVIKGEGRDSTVLQWPVDEPKTRAEFTPAAIYAAQRFGVEDLTLIVRKVDALFSDLSQQGIPNELKPQKATNPRDFFFRKVNFQHWLMCSHPDRIAELWNTSVDANGKKIGSKFDGDGAHILRITGAENFEISDCQAQGGQVHLRNLRNAREIGNQFSNEMGYCWVEMGGGAHYLVSEQNEFRASTSWGYGNIGMKYVYAAHNRTYNFVRGEREGMTLDISATPTAIAQQNIAWFGIPAKVIGRTFTLNGIKAKQDEFVGHAIMILDGPGAGQYRMVTANTPNDFTVDRDWDVQPTTVSTIGIWFLMRHMIVYKSEGFDTSAFSQLYGSFYDFTVDSCRVERNQGIWGQSGWFVRYCYNEVSYANSYHPGIGPHGNNPEGNLPFSFMGLTDGNLRITKFGSAQYGKPLVFLNEVVPHPVPGALATIVKGNTLRYNQRVAFPPSADSKPAKGDGKVRFMDIVVNRNRIEHGSAAVQIGPAARRVLLSDNQLVDIAEPYLLSKPEEVTILDK